MANFFGTQSKPTSTSGGLSVPLKAPPPAPQAAAAVAPSQTGKRELESSRQPSASADSGTLVIGQQIVLSGEVTSCTRLVVEGTIKANIKECRDIAIAEGGLFNGSAS